MDAPKVKFCGLTRPQDAVVAADLGAWAVGVILWPGSKRAVTLQTASSVAAAVRRRVEIAGVFVNPTLDAVSGAVEAVGLTLLQFHGDEGPTFCAEAARRTGCRVIKATRVRGRSDIQALRSFRTVDFHLLDSYVAGTPGGTGETFEWELARSHRSRVPLILSGGLTPANVAAAVSAVEPFAVDVASGVEVSPGVKDPALMAAFSAVVASTAETAGAAEARDATGVAP